MSYVKKIGGQAFPGGVMMNCEGRAALAVRLRSGEVKVVKWNMPSLPQNKAAQLPVVKQILSLMLVMSFSFVSIFKFMLILPKAIRFMSPLDVLRYHGAEHKTIRCYESGLDLTCENILPQQKFHPRCGTGLVIFVLISELLTLLITPKKLYKSYGDVISTAAFLIGLILGYESISYASRSDSKLAKILLAPSRLAQRFTVLEPRPDMIECAIAAVKAVI